MYSILVLFSEVLILHVTKNIPMPMAIIALMILVFSIAFIADISTGKTTSEFQLQIFGGYVLRVALLFFDLNCRSIYKLPNSGADSEWFYRQGVLYSVGKNTVIGPFYTLLGTTFKIIGNNRLYVQFLLMLLSMIAIIFAAKTITLLNVDSYNRKLAMYVLCLIPNYAILSSLFLRESIVSMFVAISIYFFVKWYKNHSVISLLIAFFCVLLGSMFHSGIMGMALGYIVLLVLGRQDGKNNMHGIKRVLLAAIISLFFIYLMNNYAEVFFGKMLRLTNAPAIENVATLSEGGGSSYAPYVGNSNSIKNIILYTPLRMFFFLGSPFIWQIRGISDIIALLFNSLFYIYVLIKSVKFLTVKSCNRNIVFGLTVVVVITAFVFSWGVTNTGTAIRHRDKMATVYALLLAICSDSSINEESRYLYIK